MEFLHNKLLSICQLLLQEPIQLSYLQPLASGHIVKLLLLCLAISFSLLPILTFFLSMLSVESTTCLGVQKDSIRNRSRNKPTFEGNSLMRRSNLPSSGYQPMQLCHYYSQASQTTSTFKTISSGYSPHISRLLWSLK